MLFVMINGWESTINSDQLEEITMAVARGEMDIEPLTIWLRQRLLQPE